MKADILNAKWLFLRALRERGGMRSTTRSPFWCILLGIIVPLVAWSQVPSEVPWATPNGKIVQPGMAVLTCHTTVVTTNPAERYVFAVMDVRERPAAYSDVLPNPGEYSNLWSPANYHHPDWTVEKLGNVYGMAMDADGNVYLTAVAQTGLVGGIPGFGTIGGYDPANPGSPASVEAGGVVYKIDGVTGVPTVLAKLPQNPFQDGDFHTNGLGQISYDGWNNQLFVSNREDGKIYRLSMTGAILSIYDPGSPDTGSNDPASDAEFVWALAVGPDAERLYYSINSADVRSVALTSGGDFATVAGSDIAEFTVPFSLSRVKIADLAFSLDGTQLLVGQRNHSIFLNGTFVGNYTHRSMSYLYGFNQSSSPSATLSRTIQVGDDREGYGGVAFAPLNTDVSTGAVTGQDEMFWFASSDILDGNGPHGLEAVPISELGNLASGDIDQAEGSTSRYTGHRGHVYVVDYDGIFFLSGSSTPADTKGSGGDIDILGGGLDAFAPPSLAIGNLVFDDANGNGVFDSVTESGIDGVAVQLFSAGGDGQIGGGDDVEINVGPDGILGTGDDASGGMVTSGGGCYLFRGLEEGDYYVLIPSGEFGVGEPLLGLVSSSGQGTDDSTDDNMDENGDDVESDGVSSNVINLSVGNEPLSEPGKATAQSVDADTNLTVDFGFTCPPITVLPAGLADGTVGVGYSETLSATGGVAPYSFTVSAGSLPAGLTLSGGMISGTPTADGNETFTITATDAVGCPGTREFTVTMTCPTLTVGSLPAVLPTGTIGDAYSASIVTSGGTGPYSYSLEAGSSLPAGLSLASDGTISGTPTGPAVTTMFTVLVSDAFGCPGSGTFTIGVDCNVLTVTPMTLVDGMVGETYGPVTFSAGGASGTVTWSQTGTLPAGLSFSGGVLSGTPTEGGSFSFSVEATDANGCQGSVNLSLSIPVANISGTTFEDTDGDGDGDVAIDVTTIRLFEADGVTPVDNPNLAGTQDYVVVTTDGTYSFTNLVPGSYVVGQDQPEGYTTVTDIDSTTDAVGSPVDPVNSSGADNEIPVELADGETDSGNDFVEIRLSLGNLVFVDGDDDGVFDSGEGVDGVTVQLFDPGPDGMIGGGDDVEILAGPDGIVGTADDTAGGMVTSGGGCYLFQNLPAGDYYVSIPAAEFLLDGGLARATSIAGTQLGDDHLGEDGIDTANPDVTGVTTGVTSLSGGMAAQNEAGKDGSTNALNLRADANTDLTVDLGFRVSLFDVPDLVGVGNVVFVDSDGDGVYDPGEGVDGVTVQLFDPGPDGVIGGGDDVEVTVGPDGVLGSLDDATGGMVTSGGGCYLFDGLPEGIYYVLIPGSEFGSGGDLEGLLSLGGVQVGDDDAGEDGLDNATPANGGVTSDLVVLTLGGEPTNTGSGALEETGKDNLVDDGNDADVDLTVDFAFGEPVALGNVVYYDSDGDGVYDDGEGVDGVTVQLFDPGPDGVIGGGDDAEIPVGPDGILGTADDGSGGMVTGGGGCYLFENLPGDSYYVLIPGSEFGAGEELEGWQSVPGQGGDTASDDDIDENGDDDESDGVSSGVIVLAAGTEPLGETGKDASNPVNVANDGNVNLTVDLAFESAKEDVFADWVTANGLPPGGDGLGDNPDGDIFNNALEYAFCLHPDSGVPGAGQFCLIKESDGTVTAQFFRRRGGLSDVTYVLEGSDGLAVDTGTGSAATVWFPIASVAPVVNTTDADVPADVEKVIYSDLQNATEFVDGTRTGLVRIRVEVDGDGSGGIASDEIHYAKVFGWQCMIYNDWQCATFSIPFSQCPVFSGTFAATGTLTMSVDGSGNVTLDVSDSALGADLTATVGSGGAYYLQLTSGPLEGERFDILGGGIDTITLVNDSGIFDETDGVVSLNTSSGLPSDTELNGSSYEVIRYDTVDEMFDKTTTYSGHEDTVDTTRLLFYRSRRQTPGFEILELWDDTVTPLTGPPLTEPVWSSDRVNFTDQGGTRLDPCGGLWIHPKLAASEPTAASPEMVSHVQVAYGMVADHDQKCALNEGYNLVGAMWPLDQTPGGGVLGRDWTGAAGFAGGVDPDLAMELLFWQGDLSVDDVSFVTQGDHSAGYMNFMYLDYSPAVGSPIRYWMDINDISVSNRDDDLFLESHRAQFLKLLPGDSKEPHRYPKPNF